MGPIHGMGSHSFSMEGQTNKIQGLEKGVNAMAQARLSSAGRAEETTQEMGMGGRGSTIKTSTEGVGSFFSGKVADGRAFLASVSRAQDFLG